MKQRAHSLLIAVMLLLLIMVVGVLFLLLVDAWVDQVEAQAEGDIAAFQYLVEQKISLQQVVKDLSQQTGAQIVVVDTNATLLADSHIDLAGVVSGAYFDANLSAARENGTATSIVRDRRNGYLRIAVGQRLETSYGPLVVSFTYLMDFLPRFFRWFIWFAIVVVSLVGVLVYLLSSYVLKQYKKPIHTLLQHTKSTGMLQGKAGRINVDSNDPMLLELTKEFNALVDRYDLLIASNNTKYSKISTLLSHIGTGIMIVDTDNSVSLINPRAEAWLGLDKAKLFTENGKTPDQVPLVAKILKASQEVNEQGGDCSFTLSSESGQLFDVTIERMYSKYEPYEHSGALVLIRDVTEMRRLERLKDEFVSNVSHELRTPLTVISGFVQTLGNWDHLPEADRTTALTIIELETERLKRLISELLVLSHIEGEMAGTEKVSFDPAPVLQEAVSLLASMAEKKAIKIEVAVGKTPNLLGRELWFKQIVTNLLENAVKYSPPQSMVGVEMVLGDDDSVVLTVTDEGMGIAVEEQEKIFERFYRVEKSRNSVIAGSGLGLAITKLMVEEFGGRISVESELGKGAKFIVVLPVGQTTETR